MTRVRNIQLQRPSSAKPQVYAKKLAELIQVAERLEDTNKLVHLLNFDLYTNMPVNGSDSRARQMMHLTRMQSEQLRSKRLSNLVAYIRQSHGSDNFSQALLDEVNKRIERERKVSPKLEQESFTFSTVWR